MGRAAVILFEQYATLAEQRRRGAPLAWLEQLCSRRQEPRDQCR